MTARKALELAALTVLLPGLMLYGAFWFVSMEPNPANWTVGWRALFIVFWAAPCMLMADIFAVQS